MGVPQQRRGSGPGQDRNRVYGSSSGGTGGGGNYVGGPGKHRGGGCRKAAALILVIGGSILGGIGYGIYSLGAALIG